jgi:hypothetical protein
MRTLLIDLIGTDENIVNFIRGGIYHGDPHGNLYAVQERAVNAARVSDRITIDLTPQRSGASAPLEPEPGLAT